MREVNCSFQVLLLLPQVKVQPTARGQPGFSWRELSFCDLDDVAEAGNWSTEKQPNGLCFSGAVRSVLGPIVYFLLAGRARRGAR